MPVARAKDQKIEDEEGQNQKTTKYSFSDREGEF